VWFFEKLMPGWSVFSSSGSFGGNTALHEKGKIAA
jgi:hypothetical protein